MNEIEEKIQQLIELSNRKPQNDWTLLSQKSRDMETLIIEIRNLAHEEHTLLGRIIQFPFDDKYSYYLITELNNENVTIECLDLYEGFIHKGYGKKSNIDKMEAECYIRGVDTIFRMYPNTPENKLELH